MTLEKEFKYFLENQNNLLVQYEGKVLIIKDEAVVGTSDTPLSAYLKACEKYPKGTFLIQNCTAGVEAFTVTISSLNLSAL